MHLSEGKLSVAKEGSLLISPGYEGVTADWFQPSFWGADAAVVDEGGRGGAWFLDAGGDEFVLRHYRRGGLIGKFVERTYIYTGLLRARSFREFRLTRELILAGLPVPNVIAAAVWRRSLCFYRAAIIVERIPEAVNLPSSTRVNSEKLWIQAGQMIRRFHDWGLDHVDLNCDNILVANDRTYLIDFDRCRRRDPSSSRQWQANNLQRLKRSVDKRLGLRADLDVERLWQQLLSGYHCARGYGTSD
ncbi:3-deoxy-D-manno-octulosonic acid kinase [Marinobacter vinifirmus]|uniref:3-deoxy-D-manno-octulosonic acid kinase n=1 Tax=Marinobacter vinifirmus TaxID=355591 RepID=A0A558BHH9_9GAMM|nr:3-deoxy-D-manno-octulosonic acid kinase [Marinobacter vinifirmus]TVT35973.1 MAG: 3-deoxy-D-manno-octulosonic acid kinase [Marinobacter vinifirmus]